MYASPFLRHPVSFLVFLTLVLMGIVVIIFMNMIDYSTQPEQMSDAAQQLSYDVRNATQMYKNREADYKAREEVKRIGDKARDSGD
jgi:cell division protein FtsL